MSPIHKAVEDYLALRRRLGFKLHMEGRWLKQLAVFLVQRGSCRITTLLALEWATQPAHAQPAHQARRLSVVRTFAQYRAAHDPRTEVPPLGLLAHRYQRAQPYIYTDDEIGRLLQAARQLPSQEGLRPRTYATLLGLLVVTGMRISEVVGLDRDDVDLTKAVLTIRKTKFGKSRLVPLHASTQRALERYADDRDRILPKVMATSFLVGDHGRRLTINVVEQTFVKLSRQVGLRGPSDPRGPRLHDLRHRFAVRTLMRWYRAGVDVERHLPELSTYLGHAHPTDTYWYLSAVPELMRLVAKRLEQRSTGRPR
jgi:integrase/recombinase XerD